MMISSMSHPYKEPTFGELEPDTRSPEAERLGQLQQVYVQNKLDNSEDNNTSGFMSE